jgi:hypothetical protein
MEQEQTLSRTIFKNKTFCSGFPCEFSRVQNQSGERHQDIAWPCQDACPRLLEAVNVSLHLFPTVLVATKGRPFLPDRGENKRPFCRITTAGPRSRSLRVHCYSRPMTVAMAMTPVKMSMGIGEQRNRKPG